MRVVFFNFIHFVLSELLVKLLKIIEKIFYPLSTYNNNNKQTKTHILFSLYPTSSAEKMFNRFKCMVNIIVVVCRFASKYCIYIKRLVGRFFSLLLKLSNNNCQSGCFSMRYRAQKTFFYSMFMLHTTKKMWILELNVMLLFKRMRMGWLKT